MNIISWNTRWMTNAFSWMSPRLRKSKPLCSAWIRIVLRARMVSGVFFYQKCWAVIETDIVDAIQTFFRKSYLPTGLNSSNVVLLLKKDSVVRVSDLRPIVLSNFFFKIISKILATRLSTEVSYLVTQNQFGFINGRSIHHCIMLGSEGINCLNRSCSGNNIACKIDNRKAFDTVRWDFLFYFLLSSLIYSL